MKRFLALALAILFAQAAPFALSARVAQAADFTLTSPTLNPAAPLAMKHVFNGFGCQGGNVSPALAWQHAPANTKSFAVTVYDPDAPTGSGWWHWVVCNIPAGVTALPEGASANGQLPPGAVQSMTDYGAPGFGGACPPKGDKPHRYIFTVYALDVPTLDVKSATMPAMVGYTLNQHTLAKASITVTFGR